MVVTNLVDLKPFDEFAKCLIESGRYGSADQVMLAAIAALRREESDDDAKLRRLVEAIEEGEASGIAKGDVMARVRAQAGLPAYSR